MAKNTFLLLLLLIPACTVTAEDEKNLNSESCEEENLNSGSDYDLPEELLKKLSLNDSDTEGDVFTQSYEKRLSAATPQSDGRKSRLSSSSAEFKAITPPIIKVTPDKRKHSDTESDHENDDAMGNTYDSEHRQKRYRKTITTKHVQQTIDANSAETIDK